MKNKILGLGTLAIVGSSAFAVVACGDEEKKPIVVEDLAAEKSKIPATFVTVDVADKTNQDFTDDEIGDDVTAKFKKITEITSTGVDKFYDEAISAGVTITAKVKTVYDSVTKQIVLTLTAKSGDKSEEKDVTITFGGTNLKDDLDKLQDFTVEKSADTAATSFDFGAQAVDADVISKVKLINGIFTSGSYGTGDGKLLKSALSSGVSISDIKVKTKYDVATAKLVLEVTLAKGSKKIVTGTEKKDVTITFGGVDLTAEVDKLLAEITGVDASKKTNFASSVNSVITKTHYTELSYLKQGQSLLGTTSVDEVKIKTATSGNKVVVTVKLATTDAKGAKYGTNTKDVSITFLTN